MLELDAFDTAVVCDVDDTISGIIFTTYNGEEVSERYTLTRQMFCDDGDQAINHRDVEDAIVAGTADALFDSVAQLHLDTFNDEYSQGDWYEQLIRLLCAVGK
jgi:hypothetical protein